MGELRTDRELLREYAAKGAESAFQALVERHLDLVFATALRGVKDEGAAREITQNVFIALARKAAWLSGETSLTGWLHRSALLEARRWWRGELRRRRREQTAVELGTVMKEEDSLLAGLAGELDDGLLELREADRQALMLRYFEGRTHRDIGLLLGAREDAVRMRIDKALARLTGFFRRRGYAVPAVATTAAVLSTAAKAAPAGLAIAATRSALAAGGGALGGSKLLLAKYMGLTKTQTAVVCAVIALAPIAWEWNLNRLTRNRAALAESRLQVMRGQEDQTTTELGRLKSESARLDGALAAAEKERGRYEAAAEKLETLKRRVKGLLTDANYHWPDDLPYVRVPKATLRSLDDQKRPKWGLGELALELYGITAQEKAPAQQALADYFRGVDDLMATTAYETNLPDAQTGRFTKTVMVPPLGQPLKALAQETGQRLTDILGAEREKLLFGGWDEGAIQLFWPGNLWKISEAPQTLTAWVEPASTTGGAPRYGFGRSSPWGGTSARGPNSVDIPGPIVEQFFNPWLEQFGITNSTADE
jgi:RNA polymerase sigma factor (sigma-70 family)